MSRWPHTIDEWLALAIIAVFTFVIEILRRKFWKFMFSRRVDPYEDERPPNP